MELHTAPLDGSTLIEASAGTGKTWTLAALFLRLLLEKRLGVDEILVVTFTDAATEELRGRIRSRLKEAVSVLEGPQPENGTFEAWLWTQFATTDAPDLLRGAVRNFDLAQIFTIHGFCRRMLVKNGFESQSLFDTSLETDLSGLRRQACLDFWRQRILPLEGETGSLIRAKVTPEELEKLASLPFLAQTPRLEPDESADSATLRSREATFCALRDALRELWLAEGQAVRQNLLERIGDFKANMVNPAKIESRFAAMENWLAKGGPSDLPKDLGGLSTRTMISMTKKNAVPPEHRIFQLVSELQAADESLHQGAQEQCVRLRRDFLTGLHQNLGQRKRERNIQGFDDLLQTMGRAVENDQFVQAVARQYQAALIDEFQDTDSLQYAIFSRLFGQGKSLFLIGDPKQAIYSFRGADLATYLAAGRQCDRRATLDTNYRSTPELIQAVNTIFSAWDNPFRNPEIHAQPVGWPNRDHVRLHEDGQPVPAMTLWLIQARDGGMLSRDKALPRICRAVTAEVSRLLRASAQGQVLLGQAALRPADIAILVETHDQGRAVQQHLCRMGIHAVLAQSASVFESDEATELLALLRAMADPRPRSAHTALAGRILGLDAAAVRNLGEDNPWLERLVLWRELWERQGVLPCLRRLLAETGAAARLLALPDGERRITNVLHCLEILHSRERESSASLTALTTWFARQVAANRQEEFQLRLDSDRDAVRIVTIHKSKGLEYPVVFCPFLAQEARTDTSFALVHEHGPVLDLGSDLLGARQTMALAEAQAERVRLSYVALTRAAAKCYLVWGWLKAELSGLAWLFHGHRQPDCAWKNLGPQQLRADLERLAGPHLEIRDLPDLPPEPLPDSEDAPDRLQVRTWTRILGPHFGLSSFSSLTRGLAHAQLPGLDESDASPSGEDEPPDTGMAHFPRGAVAGSCLHRIFEALDFKRPETVSPAVAEALGHFGFDPVWAPVVEKMVADVLQADLGGFCLAETSACLKELEFLFPLRAATLHDLTAAYQRATGLPEAWPERIGDLRFEPRHGFLTGFMDLIVRHQDRFHLIDWKSNWLGRTPEQYTPEALTRSMLDNHYFLQAHLYILALDRHLRLRLPGYAPKRHLGAVHYIYLRGIDPAKPSQGIHSHKPDPDLLRRLGRALIPEAH